MHNACRTHAEPMHKEIRWKVPRRRACIGRQPHRELATWGPVRRELPRERGRRGGGAVGPVDGKSKLMRRVASGAGGQRRTKAPAVIITVADSRISSSGNRIRSVCRAFSRELIDGLASVKG